MKASILWFDKRDGNGIVVDEVTGSEYYIDVSVIDPEAVEHLKGGVEVTCRVNRAISSTRCAKDVKLACTHSDSMENGCCIDCGEFV